MNTPRIVITGIGVFTSIGHDRRAFWDGLTNGRSGAAPITGFDTTGYKSTVAAEVKGFHAEDYLPKKRARRMARFSQLASCAAQQAVVDAGLDPASLSGERSTRAGTVIGTAAGDYEHLEKQHATLLERGPGYGHPLAVPMIIPNMSSANVAIDLGIEGPNIGIVTACSSGAHAIATAAMILQSGRADIMLGGGAEAAISPLTVNAYGCMGVLTSRNDDPTGASRPFDRDRDGFLIGEGAGVLVMEREEDARARGAEILAYLSGVGMTADAHSVAIPEPDGVAAANAMTQAVRDAGLNTTDVGYINAHGTSTGANDRTETIAIKRAFGDHAYRLAVSSNKSMIGHTLGAAGAVEAAATVLTVKHGVLPPTINYTTADPECDLDYVPNTARDAKVAAAISNSFGFGGQNCSLLFTPE
ncbi:MAG: beta-ketoacyl-ACP synthase II [Spirochaeta sp.]|jgi:3-oxoacyl-[acyl-carrier-protein] synthase II|nr:beta-ketoacyl-ACP synthase II [Spirochaeta sp.]